MTSPLQRLVVDGTILNEEVLASVLEHWVHLTQEGGLVFRPAAFSLPAKKKVLIAALAGAGLYRLGLRPNPQVSPKEVEGLTGLSGGTVRPSLRDLVDQKLLRSEGHGYIVPAYALEEVRKALSK
jgi:hypothetical protein